MMDQSNLFLNSEEIAFWEDGESNLHGEDSYIQFHNDFEFRETWRSDSEIWIIECRPEIFTDFEIYDGDKKSWWQEFMEMAVENMKRKIIYQPKSKFCILAVNTKYYLNDMGVPGIYTMLDFNILTPHHIKKVLDYSGMSWNKFESQYGGIDLENTYLPDALWVANNILWIKENQSRRRLVCYVSIFTSNDDPCNRKERAIALQRASDLKKNSAFLHLLTFEIPGRTFDISKFYMDLLKVELDEIEEYRNFSKLKFENFKNRIRKKLPNRTMGLSQTLEIYEGIEISVKIYIEIMPQKISPPIFFDPETLTPLKREFSWKLESTDTEIDLSDLVYRIPFGNEEIVITQSKMEELRNYGKPFLKIVGFVPVSAIQMELNIDHSYFVIPDDMMISGSSILFSALHQTMFLQHKAALVDWLPEKGSLLRQAALIAQIEVLDNVDSQIQPAGFHLIKLPYNEEIRGIAPERTLKMSDLDQEATTNQADIIAQKAEAALMGFYEEEYDPYQYSNPTLARHYAYLEALALDLEDFELGPNKFLEDHYDEEPSSVQLIKEWMESALKFSPREPREESPLKKRKPAQSHHEQIDEKYIKDLYNNNLLKKLTVVQMRSFLDSKSLMSKGNKAVLIELISQYLDKQDHL